ncbi:acetyltransferase domain-containing protein [Biscogniauxia sp. FL1348]|nr:acetyltransferase domain-containing protein [Biscogniauxia sp. FL1348]
MRLNEHIAISTPQILLVPYDAHHVPRYHEWMQDPVRADHSVPPILTYLLTFLFTLASPKAIQEATASEPLTLDEEFENQLSWRTSHDKLTFIVCKPLRRRPHHDDDAAAASATSRDVNGTKALPGPGRGEEEEVVYAGDADTDAPARMVGDVNLFLTPWEEEEEENGEQVGGQHRFCSGEVDIMIADPADRGRGAGKAAVAAFLAFVRRNLGPILEEYARGGREDKKAKIGGESNSGRVRLRDLVVKIKADNAGSIALFRGLGFQKTAGGVNYFGEIQMRLEGFGDGDGDGEKGQGEVGGYRECVYDRSRLG